MNFSLYKKIFDKVEGEINEMYNAKESALRALSLKYETDIPSLERMCYIMEEVLMKNKSDAVVYAGFQKRSRAKAIWERYLKIADNVKKIYLFGEPDLELKIHSNIEFINISKDDELYKEWFLVIDKKMGKSMMVAYDLDGFGKYSDEKMRKFKGAKTTDPKVVSLASEYLNDFLNK